MTLQQDLWGPKDPCWKSIWKCQGPQRDCIFLWLAFQQHLLIIQSAFEFKSKWSYEWGYYPRPSRLHSSKRCVAAFVPTNLQNKFFSEPFHSWILSNICSPLYLQEHGVLWANLFGIISWKIWKNRNLFIIQNLTHSHRYYQNFRKLCLPIWGIS